jgi:hypothetical protein
MRMASDWFDVVDISEADQRLIGRDNARRIFPNLPEKIGSPAEAMPA